MPTPDSTNTDAESLLERMPSSSLKVTLAKAAGRLSPTEKTELSQRLNADLPSPDGRTPSVLWLLVVTSFCVVLVGAFATLAVSMFLVPPAGGTKAEIVLTMFTTVVGFLAGLFVPSPAATK
jgi:hypothetical protein